MKAVETTLEDLHHAVVVHGGVFVHLRISEPRHLFQARNASGGNETGLPQDREDLRKILCGT